MIVSHIVATDERGVIGRDGKMPWHLSADLKRFKQLTMGHTMIMGRKTYESIGKALPGRKSIVVSRQQGYELADADVVASVDAALVRARELIKQVDEEVFIIGGGELYRQTMPLIERIYLTRIHRDVGGGDAHYPDLPCGFREKDRESYSDPEEFSFLLFEKI
jgi:dihydrofolate reductase